MTPEKLLELAQKFGTSETTARPTFYLHDGSPTGETYPQIDWKFGQEDLIAFAQAVIDAERGSSDDPVAYMMVNKRHRELFSELSPSLHFTIPDRLITWEAIPLYRHPPSARKLTDEDIKELWEKFCDEMGDVYDLFRAIERRINGEKE